MFKKRKNRKNTRDNSKGLPPIDRVHAGHTTAAYWYNRSLSSSVYDIKLSRRYLDRDGQVNWSMTFGPEDIQILGELTVNMARHFSHDPLLSRRLRSELRTFAEVFTAAFEAMEFAETETGNVHHLNGVNRS